MELVAPSIDTATTTTSRSGSAKEAADVNFNTFLKLLAAQLENQDPLNPLDGTAFTEQIASFSALEQQIATNANLEKLLENRDFSQQSMAVGFIGKEVLAPGNLSPLKDGKLEFTYQQDEQAVSTVIEIFDAEGVKLKTIDANTEAGQHNIVWDGIGDNEQAAPEGSYLVRISSFDGEGLSVNPKSLVFQEVKGVRSDGAGGVFLDLENGENISLSDAFTVREPREAVVNSI